MQRRNLAHTDGPGGAFPATRWLDLESLSTLDESTRIKVLNDLFANYWKPVYRYLRGAGLDTEAAQDLTQGFFLKCIKEDFFAKADRKRGRFRTFLLFALKNYVQNVHRYDKAAIRWPKEGIFSLDEMMDSKEMRFEPGHNDTPEAIFERAWASNIIQRVLAQMEQECLQNGRNVHYEIFRRRKISPAEDEACPSMQDLAKEFRISSGKRAQNLYGTALRIFMRILIEEVRTFALSEDDVEAEIKDLLRILARR